MPLVKEIALFLNLSISFYFFYYQLLQSPQSQKLTPQQQTTSALLKILKASIVFISPFLHILALKNTAYCFKGHCPTPKHCITKNFSNPNKYTSYFYNFNTNWKALSENNSKKPDKELIHFTQQNEDLIKESMSSSKEENMIIQHNLSDRRPDRIRDGNGLFLRLKKIQNNVYSQQEPLEQQKNLKQSANVNEFSNIPFFRNSRRLSNIRNSDSPRISRKSIVESPSALIQPLMKLNVRKYQRVRQTTPKKVVSSSFPSENTQSIPPFGIQCEQCQECQIPKYLRMKHCYRCNKCVHKYDHHCVLLNICIGQANQKYYIAFLYAHLYNTVLVLSHLLLLIKGDVFIDQRTGIQYLSNGYTLKAFCTIALLLNLILTVYLVLIHTKFFFNGSTTYEKERRQAINYFRHLKKNYYHFEALKTFNKEDIQTYHPFNQGWLTNAWKIIKAGHNPYDWQLPFKECNTNIVELDQRKQNAKQHTKGQDRNNFQLRQQWGQESESSNNIHAGKTTKSRQSITPKSKEEEQKLFQRLSTKR